MSTTPPCPNWPSCKGKQRATWCLVQGGKLGAICSVWTEEVPCVDSYRTAVLGHFFAQEPQAGIRLLDYACVRLREQGIDYVIGPMDGNSWHRYRLVTMAGERSPFLLEYYTPCDWPAIFTAAGFAPLAGYSSAQTATANYQDPSAAKFVARADKLGVTLRPFDPARAQTELTALYALSVQSFAHNVLYSPIDRHEFLALYTPLLPYIVPDLFLLAEHAGQLVGFVLAVPDYLQQARGAAIDTIIIKTLARHPARHYAGLGSYLAQAIHERAAALGYQTAIHALMHDDNASRIISDKSAQTIRRYALYGKVLHE
ncbi:MAG: GNAT family N-acetyltransferase [Caldilineaceae bacterium]